jgi:hypothetical protein
MCKFVDTWAQYPDHPVLRQDKCTEECGKLQLDPVVKCMCVHYGMPCFPRTHSCYKSLFSSFHSTFVPDSGSLITTMGKPSQLVLKS